MKNNFKKEISIPFIIPTFIIIISIVVFIKFSKPNLPVIAETNLENEKKVENEIIPTPTNTIEEETAKNNEDNNTQTTTAKTSTYTINGKQYTVVGILNIPSLSIEYPILSETSTELLKVSLNKYWGANPNEVGNMVVLGHNYKDNKFFSNLYKIQLGDIVKITDLTGKTLDYKVYDTYVIDPYDNSCTSQLTNGKREITLITCHYEKGNSHATKRLVVKASAD